MKNRYKYWVLVALVLAGGLHAQAELVGTITLTPTLSHFEAHDELVPGYPARTYVNDPDTWDFDLSAFSGPVSIELKVDDYYPAYADDYDLYWDGNLLGNTLSAYDGYEFSFQTTPITHTLRVEYANQFSGWTPSSGGSWYDLWIDAELVPVPGAVLLGMLGLGAAGLKLRKSA